MRTVPPVRRAVPVLLLLSALVPGSPLAAVETEAEPRACLAPGTYDRVLALADGVQRYRLHVPAGANPDAALVVQFHGGGSTGPALDAVTGFSELADAEGFLVLTPEGWRIPGTLTQVWNAGACCGPTELAPDHVAATAAMLDDAAALGACFDPDRVFATGHSNGGMMAYRVACELPDRFAAVAVSAGYLASFDLDASPPVEVFSCRPSRPLSVLHVHGLQDLCVPYGGGQSTATGNTSPSIEQVVARWRILNGCGRGTDRSAGDVRRRRWRCAGSSRVELITVAPLGHAWAGSDLYGSAGLCGGTTTQAVSTTAEAWRFFHSVPGLSAGGFEDAGRVRAEP